MAQPTHEEDTTSSGCSRTRASPTCLSSEEHSDNVKDRLVHYMGCIEYCDRRTYYNSQNESTQKEIAVYLRRIQHLRQQLEKTKDEARLVKNISDSLQAWRNNCPGARLDKIREWRKIQGKNIDNEVHDPTHKFKVDDGCKKDYDPDRDIFAHVIQFKDGVLYDDPTIRPKSNQRIFSGHKENQKISVHDLLYDSNINPLGKGRSPPYYCSDISREDKNENRIQYFHFPTNNMKWVQDAIARYYEEEEPSYTTTGNNKPKQTTQSNTLLHHDFWLGQEHGKGSSIMHARHMRPLCERVSSNPNKAEPLPRNMVLFMPYLHWELDHQREGFTAFVDKSAQDHRQDEITREDSLREKRRKERQDLHKIENTSPSFDGTHKRPSRSQSGLNHKPVVDATDIFYRRMYQGNKNKFQHIKLEGPRRVDGRIVTTHKLGQLLYDAFKLYKFLDNYGDRKLLEKYLFEDPSLHARRTLDQAYHWTLRNTTVRDRDQVVYRGTSAPLSTLHHYRPEIKSKEHVWNCPSDEDGTKTQHRECRSCRETVKKVPRLVMVDQLWMWILDDKTIITCFPKRYGHNRQDNSGVHKTIRNRVEKVIPGQIQSVYDLALIIIDECSNIFFDRTKLDLRKPQVLEIFSEAIGNMAQQQTIAFNRLWYQTAALTQEPQARHIYNMPSLQRALLNITHEGKLQRETKDIIEELDIMIYLTKKQKEVLKRFKRHAENLLDKDSDTQSKTKMKPIAEPEGEGKYSFVTDYSRKPPAWKQFRANADNVLEDTDDHLEELEALHRSAESVCKSIDHLLALKQQQASVVQARQAIQQGEEAVKQGRAIMIFTIITIIFLPLAFVAAIFGMNNDVFGENKMSFKTQLKLMFGISSVVIAVVIFIAFSNFIRAVMWSSFYFLANYVLIRSGLYALWLRVPEHFHSQGLVRWIDDKVRHMQRVELVSLKEKLRKRLEEDMEREEKSFKKDTSHSATSSGLDSSRGDLWFDARSQLTERIRSVGSGTAVQRRSGSVHELTDIEAQKSSSDNFQECRSATTGSFGS